MGGTCVREGDGVAGRRMSVQRPVNRREDLVVNNL
jgi:hypothetical protein